MSVTDNRVPRLLSFLPWATSCLDVPFPCCYPNGWSTLNDTPISSRHSCVLLRGHRMVHLSLQVFHHFFTAVIVYKPEEITRTWWHGALKARTVCWVWMWPSTFGFPCFFYFILFFYCKMGALFMYIRFLNSLTWCQFIPILCISVCVFSWNKTNNPEPWNKLDPTYQYKVIQNIQVFSVRKLGQHSNCNLHFCWMQIL